MILYEEAQGGRVAGDLSALLEAVSVAVQNLVQVSSCVPMEMYYGYRLDHNDAYILFSIYAS